MGDGELLARAPSPAKRSLAATDAERLYAAAQASTAGSRAKRAARTRGWPAEECRDFEGEVVESVYKRLLRAPTVEDPAKYATTVIINAFRRRAKKRTVAVSLPADEREWGYTGGEVELLSELAAREIVEALRGVLTPRQFEIYLHRHAYDLKPKAIAQLLDIDRQTVKTHLRDANRRVAENLEHLRYALGHH